MIRAQSKKLREFQSTKKGIKVQIELNNGNKMSVQASGSHYCTPRKDSAGMYSAVEIGFTSQRIELLMPYAEDKSCPTRTVYGWVPTSVLAQVIQESGGIKFATNKSFKMTNIDI